MLPPILVELKANAGQFMTTMSGARAEVAKLGTESSAHIQQFAAIGKAALVGTTVAAVAVGVESLKMAAEFQSSMELIRTQAGQSQAEVDKMSKAVLALAGPTATAPNELAAGLYHLESAGLHGAKALQALKIAAEGAKIGHADLESVTNALNAAIASGIPGVENMQQAMGALNAVVGAGDMRMQDLADAMGTGVLASVKGFGLSLNDVGAALATFGDNNIRGAEAATQLRMAVLFMAKPAASAKDALAAIGLTTKSLADDMQHGGLNQALTDLHSHLVAAGDTGAKMGSILLDAFGKKAGTGISILEQQFGRFQSKTKEVAEGATGFGSAWQATTKTLSFQVSQLRATAESLAVQLGMALIPILEKVAVVTADVVHWFEQHITTAEILGGVVGTVLVTAILTYIATVAIAAVQSVASFATMIAKALMWAATTTGAASEAEVAFVAANAGMMAAGVSSAAALIIAWGPILLALAAIGIAAYELYTHWSTVWGAIKTITLDVVHAVETTFGAVTSFIHDHAAIIVGAIALISPPIALLIVVIHELYEHWSTVWGAITTVTTAVWHVLEPIFAAIVKVGIAVVKTAIQDFQTVWEAVWNNIMGVVSAVWSFLKPIFDTIKNAIHDITKGLGSVEGVASKIGGAVGSVGHLLGFASGTDYAPGGVALVGERGPELVNLPRGSQVVPNHKLGQLGGSVNVERGAVKVEVHVANGDPVTVRDAAQEAVDAAFAQLVRELRSGRR